MQQYSPTNIVPKTDHKSNKDKLPNLSDNRTENYLEIVFNTNGIQIPRKPLYIGIRILRKADIIKKPMQ